MSCLLSCLRSVRPLRAPLKLHVVARLPVNYWKNSLLTCLIGGTGSGWRREAGGSPCSLVLCSIAPCTDARNSHSCPAGIRRGPARREWLCVCVCACTCEWSLKDNRTGKGSDTENYFPSHLHSGPVQQEAIRITGYSYVYSPESNFSKK